MAHKCWSPARRHVLEKSFNAWFKCFKVLRKDYLKLIKFSQVVGGSKKVNQFVRRRKSVADLQCRFTMAVLSESNVCYCTQVVFVDGWLYV